MNEHYELAAARDAQDAARAAQDRMLAEMAAQLFTPRISAALQASGQRE